MAVLLKKRLFNPSSRKRKNPTRRKLSAKQKLFFGTKRQRAAVKATSSRKHKRRNSGSTKRVKNIGEIITLSLPKRKKVKNPMAATRRRNTSSKRRSNVSRRRRNAPKTWSALYHRAYSGGKRKKRSRNGVTARRRSNGSASRVIVRYRNPSRRRRANGRYSRRRNPGFVTDNLTRVAGILGGATLTNIIAKKLPSNYTTGTLGYATLTGIALAQGYVVKKFLKNDALGEDLMIGGLVLVAMKAMSDLFPSLSLSLSGLGLIGNSSFPFPQVPVAGSMGRFMIPPNYQTAINNSIPATPINATGAKSGIGAVTMGGVTRARRVGRLA